MLHGLFTDEYAFLVTCDDEVFVMGDNRSGQLGIEAEIPFVNSPKKVPELCGLGIIGRFPKFL
jgi:hypothetical protein